MCADQANTPSQPSSTTGAGQQIRLHVDERQMQTHYANGFRTHATAEEVIVDFGMNMAAQAAAGASADAQVNDINFLVNERIILNYYTAKRLALSLGQMIRRHEEQFGELKLNVSERIANHSR